MPAGDATTRSPWRSVFETVRAATGTHRDHDGTVASINWLRRRMERRGANPNVVRNVIYRDKGRLEDKRVLWDLLQEAWALHGEGPLQAPEIEVLIRSHGNAEHDMLRILQREKRLAFRSFVRRVRDGASPKLLVLGRPGSGKTLLVDHIERALELPPAVRRKTIRLEFGRVDLATSLLRLADAVGLERGVLEARLAKVTHASAFAVQADAMASVARSLVDAVAVTAETVTLLWHVSTAASDRWTLGDVDLRLATPAVPRVHVADWLWHALLEPVSRIETVALLASTTEPWTQLDVGTGGFGTPVQLTPPTQVEARKFVRSRMRGASSTTVDDVVRRAGRSFEELRTLTLLAEARGALEAPSLTSPASPASPSSAASAQAGVNTGINAGLNAGVNGPGAIDELVRLADLPPHEPLGSFLRALAVVALPEHPTFTLAELAALRPTDHAEVTELERAFLDDVPGEGGRVRCFSRELAERLRRHVALDRSIWRTLHAEAAKTARERTGDVAASRRLLHLLAADAWESVADAAASERVPLDLLRRTWSDASNRLSGTHDGTLEAVALAVVERLATLGSIQQVEATEAMEVLRRSDDPEVQARVIIWEVDDASSRGAWAEALAHLERFVGSTEGQARMRSRAPSSVQLCERWARVDVDRGRPDAAATRLTHGSVSPLHAPAIWTRIELALGRTDAAWQILDEATAQGGEPADLVEHLRLRAECLARMGRWEDAAETWTRVLDGAGARPGRPWDHAQDLLQAACAARATGRADDGRRFVDAASAVLAGGHRSTVGARAVEARSAVSSAGMASTHLHAAWALQRSRQALHACATEETLAWATVAVRSVSVGPGRAPSALEPGAFDVDGHAPMETAMNADEALHAAAVQTCAEAYLLRASPVVHGDLNVLTWSALSIGIAGGEDVVHALSLLDPWLRASTAGSNRAGADRGQEVDHRTTLTHRRARLLALRAVSVDLASQWADDVVAASAPGLPRWIAEAHAWLVAMRRGDLDAPALAVRHHPGWRGPARLRAWFHAVAVGTAMPHGPTPHGQRVLDALAIDDLPEPWKRSVIDFASRPWSDATVVAAVPSLHVADARRPRDRWVDATLETWHAKEERT